MSSRIVNSIRGCPRTFDKHEQKARGQPKLFPRKNSKRPGIALNFYKFLSSPGWRELNSNPQGTLCYLLHSALRTTMALDEKGSSPRWLLLSIVPASLMKPQSCHPCLQHITTLSTHKLCNFPQIQQPLKQQGRLAHN